jgi:hypothetical protein
VKGLYRPELFLTLARAVWFQDAPLARLLATASPVAAEHLIIDGDVVTLDSPEKFEEQYIIAREFITKKKIQTLEAQDLKVTTPSMRSRARTLSLQLKLWSTSGGKKNLLVGIILPDGFICTSADDIFDALVSFWKPTFAKKTIDVPGATIFAKKFCCSLDFSNISPLQHFLSPTFLSMRAILALAGMGYHTVRMSIPISALPPCSPTSGIG